MKPEEIQLLNNTITELNNLKTDYGVLKDLFYRMNQIDKFYLTKPLVAEEITSDGGLTINGSLNFSHKEVTATYTMIDIDYLIECTGTFTVTLPTAVGIKGRVYHIKNVGTGTITVDPDGTETIDGNTTLAVTQWDNLLIMSNNTNWIII